MQGIPDSGTVSFTHGDATYQTYYKRFGDLTGTRVPLVVLHGGPGLVHDYLLPLAGLAERHDIPVIFYDQLGNGRSSHISQKPASFWSIDLFVAELDNLIHKLAIQDRFNLLGHSWGAVLAIEYLIHKLPSGLTQLVLSNPLASQQLWNRSNMELVKKFPQHVREGLKAGTRDTQRYWEALNEYYAVHGCVVDSGRELFMKTVGQAIGPNGDPTVSNSHILKTWSIIDNLHLICVSTLIITGRHDISQDFVIQPFLDEIRSVQWIKFENSSHTPFLEEPDQFLKVVNGFLST